MVSARGESVLARLYILIPVLFMVLNCIVSPSSPVGMVPRDARAPPTNQGLSDAMRLRFCLTMWELKLMLLMVTLNLVMMS